MANLTPGLIKALKPTRVKSDCKSCGFSLPIYPGRYPKSCPICSTSIISTILGKVTESEVTTVQSKFGQTTEDNMDFRIENLLDKVASDNDVKKHVDAYLAEMTGGGTDSSAIATAPMPMAPQPLGREREGAALDRLMTSGSIRNRMAKLKKKPAIDTRN